MPAEVFSWSGEPGERRVPSGVPPRQMPCVHSQKEDPDGQVP
jgi:hypothetical protein